MWCMLFLLTLIYIINGTHSLQCMDENNQPVDWFTAYKLPKLKHENGLINEGNAYLYMTSLNNSKWIYSNISINSSNSLIGNSIASLYSTNEDIFHLLYNDETPSGTTNGDKGHTKGVVLSDKQSGIWLVHSTPHFPADNDYYFPKTGTTYGQSFLCLTLNMENLNEVGRQLKYNEPNIYSVNVPKSLIELIPELFDVANNKTVKSSPWYRKTIIQTKGNQQFVSFAKSKYFGKDLYSAWVAPTLQTDMFVETWRKGPGNLPSNCGTKYKINNVEEINLMNVTFSTTDDHSKWAVSESLDFSQWICIGDINRQEHQLKRGGGTVCINNKNLSTNYLKSIIKSEDCQ